MERARNEETEKRNNNGDQLPRYWYGNDFEAVHVDRRKPKIGYILDEDGNYPEGN